MRTNIDIFICVLAALALTFLGGAIFQIWWQVNTDEGREWLKDNVKRNHLSLP